MMVVGIESIPLCPAVCWGRGEDPLLTFRARSFNSPRRGGRVVERMARYERLTDEMVGVLNSVAPRLIVLKGYGSLSGPDPAELPEFGGILRWRLVNMARVVEVEPVALDRFVNRGSSDNGHPLVIEIARRHGVMLQTEQEVEAYCLWRLGLKIIQTRSVESFDKPPELDGNVLLKNEGDLGGEQS